MNEQSLNHSLVNEVVNKLKTDNRKIKHLIQELGIKSVSEKVCKYSKKITTSSDSDRHYFVFTIFHDTVASIKKTVRDLETFRELVNNEVIKANAECCPTPTTKREVVDNETDENKIRKNKKKRRNRKRQGKKGKKCKGKKGEEKRRCRRRRNRRKNKTSV